eukprot:1158430-Pelagomonas_calceolata.AAC.3
MDCVGQGSMQHLSVVTLHSLSTGKKAATRYTSAQAASVQHLSVATLHSSSTGKRAFTQHASAHVLVGCGTTA